MLYFKKILVLFLCFLTLLISARSQSLTAYAYDELSFIVLSQYSAAMDIGDEFHLLALSTNGKLPTWKSSNSKIASVNTYGVVTAKKAGTVRITAKIKNAEASCRVTVNKTIISISQTQASMERGEIQELSANTSNHSRISWKSSKKSIASIDENGTVIALKPGETTITATADGSSAACKITVKYPLVKLNKKKITLFRGQTAKIIADVSSSIQPLWKTNKKSIALVDETGTVTALKHGTANITATVDKVSVNCEVLVEKPVITLCTKELNLKTGQTITLTATVSSGNPCTWSSSNYNIAAVNEMGKVTALHKGKAYIYATEDGTKVRCSLQVTE